MNSRRTTNVILVIILLLIIVAGLFYFFSPSKTVAPENTNGVATSTNATSSFSYIIKTNSQSDNQKAYTIQSSYPIFSLSSTAAEKKMNTSVVNLIGQEIASYKSSFDDNSIPGGAGEYGTSTFQIDFKIVTNDRIKNILPLQFTENFYSAGAAHPGESIITKNYNLSTGEEITIAGLFKPNSAYLEALSNYSIKTLKQKLGSDASPDDIAAGAGPTNENFDHFLITDQGLLIIFNEYQVASYAAGSQEVTIPYATLQDILNPNLNLI